MLSDTTIIQLVFIFLSCVAAKYPSNFPLCYRDDPNLQNCLLEATETMRPLLIGGIKSLGIPVVEPYVVPEVTFEQGSQAVTYKMHLKNLTISGLSSYKFEYFRFDPKTLTMTTKAHFDPLATKSECFFNGQILVVPLNGKGTLLTTLNASILTSEMRTRLVKRNGKNYIESKDITLNLDFDGGTAKFDNFEGARPEIVSGINKVIEENADDLIKDFQSTFVEFLTNFEKSLFDNVFRRFSYDELFPLLPQK